VGPNVTTFSDASVAGGTTYEYVVFAVNSLGNSAPSNLVQVTTPTIPNAPSNPVLTLLGNINNPVNNPLRLRFVFFDNATNETGFVVERSVNGGAFAPLTTLPLRLGTGSVTYVDYAISVGNTYAYQVKAMNGLVWGSAYATSATVSVTPPLAPSNLAASAVVGCTNTCAVVTLTWTDNSTNESGFELQRATNATFTTGLNTWNSGINTTSSSRNVNRNRDYWFRIRAVGNAGPSAWVTIGPFHTP
jgi:predicted phage tail protein